MKFLITLTLFLSSLLALEIPDSLDADFTQTITNEHNQTLTYKGKIYFQTPNTSKWIYTAPAPKSICVDSANIIIIEDDLEQATIYQNKNYIDFTQLYSDARELQKDRYITYFQDQKYFLELKNNKLHTLSFTDNLQNHSKIEFNNVIYNQKLPSLKCNIPNHYDVILE